MLEAHSGKNRRGGGAADADPANRDDIATLRIRKLAGSFWQFLQWNQARACDVSQLAAKFLGLANVNQHRRIGTGKSVAQFSDKE